MREANELTLLGRIVELWPEGRRALKERHDIDNGLLLNKCVGAKDGELFGGCRNEERRLLCPGSLQVDKIPDTEKREKGWNENAVDA